MILEEVCEFLIDKLPSVPEIKEIVIGSGFTGVLLSNGDAGISMNIRGGSAFWHNADHAILGQQIGRKALAAVADTAEFSDTVFTSFRVALLNALSSPFLSETHLSSHGRHVDRNENTTITATIRPEDIVTLVGFGGMVRELAQRAAKVYVTELDTDFCKSMIITEQGIKAGPTHVEVVHASQSEDVFKRSDKIFITGSAIVTHTMEALLALCPPSAEVIIYGHSASFYPIPLFERGAHLLAARKVTNAGLMMNVLKNYGPMVERFFPKASEEFLIR